MQAALKQHLAPGLRARARIGNIEAVEYARYASAEDDRLFDDLTTSVAAKATIQSTTLEWLQTPDDLDCARELRRLAVSRMRPLVPPHVKRRIAEQFVEADGEGGAWTPYLRLCELYDGRDFTPPPIGEAEKARLREDLDVLLASESIHAKVLQIDEWLGPLRPATRGRLEALALKRAPLWPASRDVVERVPQRGANAGVPAETLTPIGPVLKLDVRTALFEDPDPERLHRLLATAETNAELRRAFANELDRDRSSPRPRECPHLALDATVVALLEKLPEARQSVLAWLERADVLFRVFGPDVQRLAASPGAPLDLPRSLVLDVVGFLQTRPDVLELWTRQLAGHRGPALQEAIVALTRERQS